MRSNLLTVNDAAKILKRAPCTIIWYDKTGKLKAQRTRGGMRLFRLADVERLAANQSGDGQQKQEATS